MSQLSVIAALQYESVSPKDTQGGEYLPSKICQAAVTPYSKPRGSSGCETQDIGSIAEMHMKGMVSVRSDSRIFPGMLLCFGSVAWSCLTLCDPMNSCKPTRIFCPWDSPGKNTGVGCHFPLHPMHRKALNSLTWDIWFSSITNNLLMFRLSALCCKTSI